MTKDELELKLRELWRTGIMYAKAYGNEEAKALLQRQVAHDEIVDWFTETSKTNEIYMARLDLCKGECSSLKVQLESVKKELTEAYSLIEGLRAETERLQRKQNKKGGILGKRK